MDLEYKLNWHIANKNRKKEEKRRKKKCTKK